MPKNSISRKVLTMNNLTNKKIVQHNDLITSAAKMDTISLKLFEVAVASLDTKNIPEDRTVYVSKELFFSLFNEKSGAKHTRLNEAMLKMRSQASFHMRQELGPDKFEMKVISPIEEIKWNNYDDTIEIQFTSKIMPFLVELKSNFTQYLLRDIARLKSSKYSLVLYKWLSMNYNQYQHYQFKGNRTAEQLELLKKPVISIEEIRRITNTEETYGRTTDFFKNVLDVAVSEITKETMFNVDYIKNKKGNRFESIQFCVTQKEVAPNVFYKEEEQDPDYLQDKEEKGKEIESLYGEAVASSYTEVLGDNMLIGFKDIRDKQLMASLQKSVYPLYDELKNNGGIDHVKKHIEYVANKIEDYSKKNIVKYLHVAISDYLPRVSKEKKAVKPPENPVVDPPKPRNTVDNSGLYYNWLDE